MSCSVAPAPAGRLARFGDAMRRHRGWIVGLQWAVLAVYLFLVVTPAFLPLPASGARLWGDLTLFAQFVFWGLWWPFVLLSMMLMGRVWCGVLCPEGFLAEQASRVGLGRPVPRWIKWGGWPFVAFVLTTVYGQLVSVYEYARAALLVLGGSTVAAVAVGLVYGRGKRVWCRHLCPVSGVFGLLARLAPVHFRTDRAVWEAAPARTAGPVDCAPLVDIRRMESASDCHMCGRCAGHRGAVSLTARLPGSEVARLRGVDVQPWEVRLLVFGVIGTAIGAFQWSASPWFVRAKLTVAEWLVEREAFVLLDSDIPWWLLTHYPEASDVFTWLDGLMILGYIGAAALLIGGWISLWLRVAGFALGEARAPPVPGLRADSAWRHRRVSRPVGADRDPARGRRRHHSGAAALAWRAACPGHRGQPRPRRPPAAPGATVHGSPRRRLRRLCGGHGRRSAAVGDVVLPVVRAVHSYCRRCAISFRISGFGTHCIARPAGPGG